MSRLLKRLLSFLISCSLVLSTNSFATLAEDFNSETKTNIETSDKNEITDEETTETIKEFNEININDEKFVGSNEKEIDESSEQVEENTDYEEESEEETTVEEANEESLFGNSNYQYL